LRTGDGEVGHEAHLKRGGFLNGTMIPHHGKMNINLAPAFGWEMRRDWSKAFREEAQGLKPVVYWGWLAARLKSCPCYKARLKTSFFAACEVGPFYKTQRIDLLITCLSKIDIHLRKIRGNGAPTQYLVAGSIGKSRRRDRPIAHHGLHGNS
jgi:hypothetical protein